MDIDQTAVALRAGIGGLNLDEQLPAIVMAVSSGLLAAVVAPVALQALGFSATGPVAGSVAAAWQASIGLVPAGSPFALVQSLAMGGVTANLFLGAIAFIAVAITAAVFSDEAAVLAETVGNVTAAGVAWFGSLFS